MKDKWVKLYLDLAKRVAEESHAVRLKVGAVFVSPDGVMSIGINGMPAGGTNVCEEKVYDNTAGSWLDIEELQRLLPYEDSNGRYRLVTKPEVSHAEENCYSKMLNQGVSAKGGTLFLTHPPCLPCAKQIRNSGTTAVYYANEYKNRDGVNWLNKNNIPCVKVDT